MKGIILAGGKGTRLYPITLHISKQLLPVYDKPMIYYPLSTLMLAGIREILIISTKRDINNFKDLLGNGKELGLDLKYKIQEKPIGIAHSFIIGEKFINKDNVSLILGDNIFYGHGLTEKLTKASQNKKGATIFAYSVKEPQRFGIIELDKREKPLSIEEKPEQPKSNWAVVGLYFFDNKVIDYAKSLKPSQRGELEITDINRIYLQKRELKVELLGRGFAWLDTGTFSSLIEASNFIKTIEERQGFKIACIEEISYNNGWITEDILIKRADLFKNSNYGEYLLSILKK